MRNPEASLFSRLLLLVTFVLAAGAATLLTAAWFYARAAADDAYDQLLRGATFQIADGLTVENGHLTVNMPSSAFELLGLAERDRIFYRVIDTEGRTLTGYEDLAPGIETAAITTTPTFLFSRYNDDDVRMAVTSHAISDPSLNGRAIIIIAQTTDAREALASELTTRASLLVVVMSIFALIATALALRYALRPVSQLAELLRVRGSQDLTPLGLAVPRELSPFVASINHFMSRLDERMKLLQRFVGDSAHQMRTPLTALTAQLSLIDEEGLSRDHRHHLTRARDRASELALLTNQLLSHAMVIHRFDSAELVRLDLTDVARGAFRAAIPITIDPDIIVSFEAPEQEVPVMGDSLSLREAMVNVIDNSLRHGVVSRLEVRIARTESAALLEVEDDGPGIGREHWEDVTRRFVTTKSGKGSAGIGFAIASEVAAVLGGELLFREKSDVNRFAVIIKLPLAKE